MHRLPSDPGRALFRQPASPYPCPAAARQKRRGAAAVEFAILAPLLFLILLGIVEVGRMLMVQQVLTNGAREGARKAILPGATDAEVVSTIDNYMSSTGIQGCTRQVSPSVATARGGDPITVTVTVPYNNVTWLPTGAIRWFQDKNLTTNVVMRKEPE